VRTAPSKAPRTQEYALREFPRFPLVAGSFGGVEFSVVICLPNDFSVKQAETRCPHSFPSRTQLPLPKKYTRLNSCGHGLRFADTHDRMILGGLQPRT
jgi:hypothetical protein